MDLTPPTTHPRSLRFNDSAWERAFWSDAAPNRARQAITNVRPLVLFALPMFMLYFATRTQWPPLSHIGTTTVAAGLWVGSLFWGRWARTAHFQAHVDFAYGIYLFGIGFGATLLIALTPGDYAASYGLPLMAIFLLRIMMVTNYPFIALCWLCTAVAGLYLIIVPIVGDFDAQTWLGHSALLGGAFGVGVTRAKDAHAMMRQEFVFRTLSEQLVSHMLPDAIAARVKSGERMIADAHPEVSILFADLAGFTILTQRVEPHALVTLLDDVFSRFDGLAESLGVEKIKTIGDAYMAVAGLPEARPDHAVAAAKMALGMRDIVAQVSTQHGQELRVRIGIDTGPVVAGIIGRDKFVYDVWGDAVNAASRMESCGEIGEIHITDQCQQSLGEAFPTRCRGTIEVKGKGPMRTWFLDPK